MTQILSILVVECMQPRATQISAALQHAGGFDVETISGPDGLARRVNNGNPDLVVIDAGSPSLLETQQLVLASDPTKRAVVLFVDQSNDDLTRAALQAGVSAYVVDGLQSKRLQPILQAAHQRFTMLNQIRTELSDTKQELEQRKVIDRAKGLLMSARGINEAAAYELLRKSAMDQGKRIAEIAQAIVTASELLS